MRREPSVEHLDLNIVVPPGLLDPLSETLQTYLETAEYVVITPRFKDNVLKINSKDFVDFSGFIDTKGLSEFEVQRFLVEVRKQLMDSLNKCFHPDLRYHYKWCLAALSSFPLGRHVADPEPSQDTEALPLDSAANED